ncbi:hypothetical protein H0486_10700 [Lachnospiraceae bacterium MD1]|jgi:L-ascorbate metabolism protein UlaG (beta-lactamase superfamily)|uniref:MBL fold metallo-hydrolase n=1 Tax=Variimorphobacter saccharofermentans TaxID=2755051 RepID=A0A839K147_9FIRM|nr:hypothetical protein [Variimorphobacter saccharofermentans]MBB2183346.1 hypothetical protein [Variimorphobacter saccharofermentans]
MDKINIRNLGVGAIEINVNNKRVLIDAFITICKAKEIQNDDIFIFTHDDADHFLADELPDIRTSNTFIIGFMIS